MIEVVDFSETIDDQRVRWCRVVTATVVNLLLGALAAGTGHGRWGVNWLQTRRRRRDFWWTGRNWTQGNYVRDLGGSLDKVRRDS